MRPSSIVVSWYRDLFVIGIMEFHIEIELHQKLHAGVVFNSNERQS